MPILRLAYSTQFLIALIAVFVLWSQVGGQNHLDLMPWYLKLGLGAGAAFAVVKATAAAVAHDHAWNGPTLKWFGIVLALLVGCGLASYYYHVYGETDEEDQDETQTSALIQSDRSADAGSTAADALTGPIAAATATANKSAAAPKNVRASSGETPYRAAPSALVAAAESSSPAPIPAAASFAV